MVDKVAVVTAGGSGMGAAAARKLSQDGFEVAILSSSGKGEALAQELGGIGVTGSNQSSDDLKRLIDLTMDRWGRIDILVNSAGSGWTAASCARSEVEDAPGAGSAGPASQFARKMAQPCLARVPLRCAEDLHVSPSLDERDDAVGTRARLDAGERGDQLAFGNAVVALHPGVGRRVRGSTNRFVVRGRQTS